MKKQEIKTTEIKWISVYDELPKDGVHVLAMIKGSEAVFTMKFDPTYGWSAITELNRCDRGCSFGNVIFWSTYNLHK